MRTLIERRIGPFSFLLAFILTLIPELALVERKYGIFSGGFGQSSYLSSATEVAVFFGSIIVCQLLLLTFLYWVARLLHSKDKNERFVHYNFVFFTATLAGIALAVKYRVLSYFSDAISFQLIKNLGGGSVIDALLYVADEASLIVTIIVATGALYWLGLKVFGINRQPKAVTSGQGLLFGRRWGIIGLVAVCVPVMLYALNDSRNIRYSLTRFFSFSVINQALAEITDFDRDGYSYFTPLEDRYPFDAARYPLALDVPGNGTDEDGFAGDFVFETIPALPLPDIQGSKKNLVLIVLESTRADAIGKIVNGMEVTPNLNKMAKSGTSVDEAFSHVGFTSPSLKSLFSGSHLASERTRSVFRDLKHNGYKIGVFSGQPETFGGIAQSVGMRESSDVFIDAEVLKDERAFAFAAKGSLLVDGQILLREFDRTMGKADRWTNPSFIYFNFQAPHFPYHHKGMKQIIHQDPIPRSKITNANAEWVAKTYWNSVAYGDWLVGQVIARLKALGVYEDTLVVVTADHGESLFDDGFFGHGHMINAQQTKIPLIINQPGVTVPQPIGLTDFHGLIMRLLGAGGGYQTLYSDNRKRSVFQYIGGIDTPASVALYEEGGLWTVVNLNNQIVTFKDLNRTTHYQDLGDNPELKARADRVINAWARERWQKHLAEKSVLSSN